MHEFTATRTSLSLARPTTPLLPRAASLVAVVLCTSLAPVQSLLWNGAHAPAWIVGLTTWHTTAMKLHAIGSHLVGAEPYDFFGRLFLPVYGGTLVGFASATLAAPCDILARRFRTVLLAALAVAMIGDIIAYWFAGRANTGLREFIFWTIEMAALAIALVASVALGVRRLMRGFGTRLASAVLLGLPIMAILATVVLAYMPHGPMLAFSLAALLVSYERPCGESQ